MVNSYFLVYVPHYFHSSIVGCLGFFFFLAVVNNIARTILECRWFFTYLISFKYMKLIHFRHKCLTKLIIFNFMEISKKSWIWWKESWVMWVGMESIYPSLWSWMWLGFLSSMFIALSFCDFFFTLVTFVSLQIPANYILSMDVVFSEMLLLPVNSHGNKFWLVVLFS